MSDYSRTLFRRLCLALNSAIPKGTFSAFNSQEARFSQACWRRQNTLEGAILWVLAGGATKTGASGLHMRKGRTFSWLWCRSILCLLWNCRSWYQSGSYFPIIPTKWRQRTELEYWVGVWLPPFLESLSNCLGGYSLRPEFGLNSFVLVEPGPAWKLCSLSKDLSPHLWHMHVLPNRGGDAEDGGVRKVGKKPTTGTWKTVMWMAFWWLLIGISSWKWASLSFCSNSIPLAIFTHILLTLFGTQNQHPANSHMYCIVFFIVGYRKQDTSFVYSLYLTSI